MIHLFIAGFTISVNGSANVTQLPSLSIVSKNVTNNVLKVTISSKFICSVSFGFILYNLSQVQSFATVQAGQSKQGSLNIDPSESMMQVNIYIVGLSEFSNPSPSDLSFEVTVSSSFILKAHSKTNTNLTVTYLFLENAPSNLCESCPTGNIYDGSGCVSLCNGNAVARMLDLNFRGCELCKIENLMVVDESRKNCRCADQTYQASANVCKPCHYSCVTCTGPESNNCKTCDLDPPIGTLRYILGNKCVCYNGYFDDNVTGACNRCSYTCLTCNGPDLTNCLTCNESGNRKLNKSQCLCLPGYVDVKSSAICQCLKYLPNGSCATNDSPICSINSIVNANGQCECITNFINVSGICTACPENSLKSNSSQCVCQPGFANQSNTCVKCPENSIVKNDICECIANYIRVAGLCRVCPANSVQKSSTECGCQAGFINKSNLCTACPANAEPADSFTCRCQPNFFSISGNCSVCPAQNFYDGVGCKQCINGRPTMSSDNRSQVCVCNANTYYIEGTCGVCKENEKYDNATNSCSCVAGFVRGSDKICKQMNSATVTKVAVGCPVGTYNMSGVCRKCSDTEQVLNNKCVCKSNLFYDSNLVCRALKTGETNSSGSIICSNGFTNKSGECIKLVNIRINKKNNRITLQAIGLVRTKGMVRIIVNSSYIPPELVASGCKICSSMLAVKMISPDIYKMGVVYYELNQFVVIYDFMGL